MAHRELGTKSDLSFTGSWIEDEQPGVITIRMDTAWGPPLPIVRELARRAPDLTFTASWEAEPMGVWGEIGEATWEAGEETSLRGGFHDERCLERRNELGSEWS